MFICEDNLVKIYKYLRSSKDRLNFSRTSKACRKIFWHYESPERNKIFKNLSQLKDVKKHINILEPPIKKLLFNSIVRGELDVARFLAKRTNNKIVLSAFDEGLSYYVGNDLNEAFRYAVEEGCLNVVKCLIRAGVDPLDPFENGLAIQWASANGHLEIVKHFCSLRGFDQIDIATCDNYALRHASKNGHIDTVKYLCSLQNDQIDLAAHDNYAIRYASENGHLEIVKYLVNVKTKTCPNGADITADDNYAVRWASANGHLEVVKYLVNVRTKTCPHGADITADNNYAIRHASQNGHLEVVKYLKRRLKLDKH